VELYLYTPLPPALPYTFMAWAGITSPFPLPSTVTGTSLGLNQAPVYCLSGTTAADEVLRAKISADTIEPERCSVTNLQLLLARARVCVCARACVFMCVRARACVCVVCV